MTTDKAQRFLDLVAQTGELNVTVLASSKYPDMRPRKPGKVKLFEYCLADAADLPWTEIPLPESCDEFDAAEEASQKAWDDSDGDGHNAFEQGETLLIRLKGTKDIFKFKVEVDYEPQFYIKPVTA